MAGKLLAESLQRSVADTQRQSDARFLFGTEVSNNFVKPPPEAYEVWRPLPVSIAQQDTHGLATHLISRSAIFPRLHTDPEEVKNKVVPHLTRVVDACKAADVAGSGRITQDQLLTIVTKDAGVFLTSGEQDMLLSMAPHSPSGHSLDYLGLVDVLLGKDAAAGTAAILASKRPPLPQQVDWPADQEFTVVLHARPTAVPFTISAAHMQQYARAATKLCRSEVDAEKVHALMRTHLLTSLVVEAGSPGRPDLAFRQWLADNSVLSLSMRRQPGPIPPEVYEVLDQVIHDGLGIPRVESAIQVPTVMGASLKRTLGRTAS